MRRDNHEERQNEEILGVLDHGESSFISRGYVQVLCFSMMDQRIVSKKEYCSSAVKSVMNCITIEIVGTFCCILCTVFMNATQKREIVNFLWSEDTAKFWRSSSVALHQERNQAFLNSAILCIFSFGCKGKDQRCVKLCDYPPSPLLKCLFLKAGGSLESLGRHSNLLKPTHYWSCVHSVISNTSSLFSSVQADL
jgi:hypothetical protein